MATASSRSEKAFATGEMRKTGPSEQSYLYVYAGGIYPKRLWEDSYENVAVIVVVGVSTRSGFTGSSHGRGLHGVIGELGRCVLQRPSVFL